MDNRPRNVVPAIAGMIPALAARLAADHRREIADTVAMPPRAALEVSLAASAEAYALVDRYGEPVFMMGVEPASPLTGSAMVWMLGTDAVRNRPALTLRTARWGLARAFRATGAKRLEQYIPEWYRTGLRFARRLGFVAVPPRLRSAKGVALCRVLMYPGE